MANPKRKSDHTLRSWAKGKMSSTAFRAGMEEARLALLIAHAREERGWTQGELARKAGMKQPEIARIESGEHNPTIETYTKVTVALGKRVTLV